MRVSDVVGNVWQALASGTCDAAGTGRRQGVGGGCVRGCVGAGAA
jgi:hypothetical protein